jgi:hypothetical protein
MPASQAGPASWKRSLNPPFVNDNSDAFMMIRNIALVERKAPSSPFQSACSARYFWRSAAETLQRGRFTINEYPFGYARLAS